MPREFSASFRAKNTSTPTNSNSGSATSRPLIFPPRIDLDPGRSPRRSRWPAPAPPRQGQADGAGDHRLRRWVEPAADRRPAGRPPARRRGPRSFHLGSLGSRPRPIAPGPSWRRWTRRVPTGSAPWPSMRSWLMSGNGCNCRGWPGEDRVNPPQVSAPRVVEERVGPARRGLTQQCHHLPDMSQRDAAQPRAEGGQSQHRAADQRKTHGCGFWNRATQLVMLLVSRVTAPLLPRRCRPGWLRRWSG